MAQTVVGIFDNTSEANAAVSALTGAGFDRNQIDVSNRSGAGDTRSTTDSYYTGSSSTNTNTSGTVTEGVTDSVSNFFSSLFGGSNEHSTRYSTVAHNSDSIVTVHAQSAEQATRAAEILDQHGAIDVDERYQQYSSQTTNTTATNLTGATNAEGSISVPVIEEELAVGKREVERGGVRLRSRVIERPIEESVRLREERVFVQRNPVNRPASEADFNTFREGEVVVTERDEVPVVAKEARVVEEVSVGKTVEEHTETISDTVRRTDVEVEEVDTNLDANRSRTTNS